MLVWTGNIKNMKVDMKNEYDKSGWDMTIFDTSSMSKATARDTYLKHGDTQPYRSHETLLPRGMFPQYQALPQVNIGWMVTFTHKYWKPDILLVRSFLTGVLAPMLSPCHPINRDHVSGTP